MPFFGRALHSVVFLPLEQKQKEPIGYDKRIKGADFSCSE